MNDNRLGNFSTFFTAYLREHRNPTNRALHYAGTTGATLLVAAGLWLARLDLVIAGPLVGYGLAWIGHFAFEQNRPMTFRYPLWSLMGDYRMLWLRVRGRLQDELAAANRPGRP